MREKRKFGKLLAQNADTFGYSWNETTTTNQPPASAKGSLSTILCIRLCLQICIGWLS